MLLVVPNREAHAGGEFDVVRRGAAEAHLSAERRTPQDRPNACIEVAETERGLADVGALMRSPVTVVDVHTAPEGSEPFHGVWVHALEVEELAKCTLKVPPFAHLIHAFTEHALEFAILALSLIGGIAHLMPEAMQVTTTGSTRTVAVLSHGRNPCFDVLFLAKHVAVAQRSTGVPKGLEAPVLQRDLRTIPGQSLAQTEVPDLCGVALKGRRNAVHEAMKRLDGFGRGDVIKQAQDDRGQNVANRARRARAVFGDAQRRVRGSALSVHAAHNKGRAMGAATDLHLVPMAKPATDQHALAFDVHPFSGLPHDVVKEDD